MGAGHTGGGMYTVSGPPLDDDLDGLDGAREDPPPAWVWIAACGCLGAVERRREEVGRQARTVRRIQAARRAVR